MGGLGNGRRGGRSPPLMIGALIACILVLGFNYWVSSSRNLELQTKLYELEGQVRRGAAERGVAENKKNGFQAEILRQKEQMNQMENLYKRQLEGAQNMCSQEKGVLQNNISSSTKTIQELKGQLNQLNNDLGKLQKELQGCHGNIKTLNKKLSYEMARCNAEVMSQKECDKRVALAKLEVEKKIKKPIPLSDVSEQEEKQPTSVVNENVAEVKADVKMSTAVSPTERLSQKKENELPELLSNEIVVDEVKYSSKVEPHSIPSSAAEKPHVFLPPEGTVTTEDGDAEAVKFVKNNLTEDKEFDIMDVHEEDVRTEENDPEMEGMMMGREKADESPAAQKTDEPMEYATEEQAVGQANVEKQLNKQPENMDLEQELSDYNGDDENEGEFEADKQAELAQG